MRKNTTASAAVERLRSNVVGAGIKPMLTGKPAQELWTKWVDHSAPDGVLNFYGQQAQVFDGVVVGGEVFVRLRNRFSIDELPVPLQVEVLEAEMCAFDKNEPELKDAQGLVTRGLIRQGVQFDVNIKSRRVGYWIYPLHPKDSNFSARDNEPVFVPAPEILHVYLPTRPGQIRGEPWLARILSRLKDTRRVRSRRTRAQKDDRDVRGLRQKAIPEGLDADELIEAWGADAEIDGNNVGQVSLEPGTMHVLAPGEEVDFSDPKDVGGMYEVFKRSNQRDIAASLGILYEQLTGDYTTVNDRTWRAAVNDFRRRCEYWQHSMLVHQFCRPVLKRWQALCSIGGLIAEGPIADPAQDPAGKDISTPEGEKPFDGGKPKPDNDNAKKREEATRAIAAATGAPLAIVMAEVERAFPPKDEEGEEGEPPFGEPKVEAEPEVYDPEAPVQWCPPRWDYINPVQDVQALREEIKAGFTSRKAVVSERGLDVAQIDPGERRRSPAPTASASPTRVIRASRPSRRWSSAPMASRRTRSTRARKRTATATASTPRSSRAARSRRAWSGADDRDADRIMVEAAKGAGATYSKVEVEGPARPRADHADQADVGPRPGDAAHRPLRQRTSQRAHR